MDSLEFRSVSPPAAASPARADVACFAGFVGRVQTRRRRTGESEDGFLRQLPDSILDWLVETEWISKDGLGQYRTLTELHHRDASSIVSLTDLPIPIESWENFDQLFAWQERPIGHSELQAHTLLGAAVRSFFAQGGRKCYIIRLGDPWDTITRIGSAADALDKILPRYPKPSPNDRYSWKGLGHLFGLSDVSYLSLPDLPDVFASPKDEQAIIPPPDQREDFVECASRSTPPELQSLQGLNAPSCDAVGFQNWAQQLDLIARFISDNGLREIQIIAAIPRPISAHSSRPSLTENRAVNIARDTQWTAAKSLDHANLQLVYPWIRSRESRFVPGNLIPPDGPFIGLLAAHTIDSGSWRSLNHREVPRIDSVRPVLDQASLKASAHPTRPLTRRDRFSLIGPTAGGLRILSDVTTSTDTPLRFASVNRLLIAILRGARIVGESSIFENNGEALWQRITESLENLLAGFWSEGALYGATAAESYEVRCDRSTMTQTDIDAGRAIARVVFTASLPITRIVVVFSLQNSGEISLVSANEQTAQQLV